MEQISWANQSDFFQFNLDGDRQYDVQLIFNNSNLESTSQIMISKFDCYSILKKFILALCW